MTKLSVTFVTTVHDGWGGGDRGERLSRFLRVLGSS